MGSDSDMPIMKHALDKLKDFGIEYEVKILSAHRTPDMAAEYAKGAMKKGI
ncbi:MAG: AIR carboxylase family protein, partial [Candidatus Omnitrophica bacterium]|nr:AIR carboxylase family protein [Candidatus Omnitrophota bacterium]